MIELRQLAALTAVGEHGGFSAAAKALFTVQSNVSTHVSHLEKELGVTLVDRALGQLTMEGDVVVQRANRVFNELQSIRLDLAALSGEVAGDVRLGVIGSTARWLVPGLLAAMRQHHPKVRAVIVEGATSALVPQLTGGKVDMAVVNLPVGDVDLDVVELFEEELILVAPEGHPLAALESIPFVDLAGQPLLLAAQGTPMRDELDHEALKAGISLVPLAEIDGVRLLFSLASEGFGPAIVPATAAPGWLSGPWRRVRVEGLSSRRVGLVRRRRGLPSAPARVLTDELLRVVVDQGRSQPGLRLLASESG